MKRAPSVQMCTDVYRCVHDLCRCALFPRDSFCFPPYIFEAFMFINVLVRAKRSIFFFFPVTKRPQIKSRLLHRLIRKKSLIVGSWMVKLGFIMNTMVWLELCEQSSLRNCARGNEAAKLWQRQKWVLSQTEGGFLCLTYLLSSPETSGPLLCASSLPLPAPPPGVSGFPACVQFCCSVLHRRWIRPASNVSQRVLSPNCRQTSPPLSAPSTGCSYTHASCTSAL